jgi:hypothetical protein
MCEPWTLGQAPRSGTAKPSSDCGKSEKASVNGPSMEGGNVVSLLWTWGRDVPTRVSSTNRLGPQIRLHSDMPMQENNHINV